MKTKIFSLILALAIIGICAGNGFSQEKPMQGKGFFRGQLLDKLQLTAEQKSKIEDSRLNHQKQMIDLKANLAKKKLALKELRVKGNLDRNSVISVVKDINQAKDEIALARANNMMDLYDILTPDQQKILKENSGLFQEFGMHDQWNMRGPGKMHGRNMHGQDGDNFPPMQKRMQ